MIVDSKITFPVSALEKICALNRFNEAWFVDQQQSNWVDQYNVIKDVTWPECQCYDDFYRLSDQIQEECINVHNFSPDLWKNNILNAVNIDTQTEFNYEDDDPFIKCVNENQHIVNGRRIVDFGCNRGKWSFLALANDCESVLGVDVRKENIDVANSIKEIVEKGSDINFVKGDIHDYENNQMLCRDADTVFLSGIMYHVHDHTAILESICLPNIQDVLITSLVNTHSEPSIVWQTEMTETDDLAGWKDGEKEILIGFPNVPYYDLVMSRLGYSRTYLDELDEKYDIPERNLYFSKEHPPTAVMVYSRN